MLIIRLQRVGRRNHAEFRVVLTEHTRGPKANYIEALGHYNPHTDAVQIDGEKVREWISKGAQVSDTVHNLLVSQKIIKGDKKNVLPKKAPIVKEEEAADDEAPAEETASEADAAEESDTKEAEAPAEKEKEEAAAA